VIVKNLLDNKSELLLCISFELPSIVYLTLVNSCCVPTNGSVSILGKSIA